MAGSPLCWALLLLVGACRGWGSLEPPGLLLPPGRDQVAEHMRRLYDRYSSSGGGGARQRPWAEQEQEEDGGGATQQQLLHLREGNTVRSFRAQPAAAAAAAGGEPGQGG